MSEIQSQEVEWLWYPFIPYGKLTIVQGDPGDGKTTLILNIAAKLSRGDGLDSEMKLSEPMNVIYQSAEDGLADTVKAKVTKQAEDIDFYKSKIHQQSSKLEQLQEKADDFERVKQYVGADKVDAIVTNARELEQIAQSRKQHNRAYGMSR